MFPLAWKRRIIESANPPVPGTIAPMIRSSGTKAVNADDASATEHSTQCMPLARSSVRRISPISDCTDWISHRIGCRRIFACPARSSVGRGAIRNDSPLPVGQRPPVKTDDRDDRASPHVGDDLSSCSTAGYEHLHPLRLITLIAIAAAAVVLIAACGSSKPGYCGDVTALENSVKSLNVSSGLSSLQTCRRS